MAKNEKRRADRYNNGVEDGGARALAGCVRCVCVFNAALTAGACALAAYWGFALPALGLALALIVSVMAFKLIGGAA